jgi:hypothetical protein
MSDVLLCQEAANIPLPATLLQEEDRGLYSYLSARLSISPFLGERKGLFKL